MRQQHKTVTTIALSLVLSLILLSAVGCSREPWEAAEPQVAELAQDVADKARLEDENFFSGVTLANERVPELMGRVARSGIATNYAEHLQVESDTKAALVYGQDGSADSPDAFSIQLSLEDGSPRIDQIVVGERSTPTSGSPDAIATPRTPTGGDVGSTGSKNVYVSIAGDWLVAGSNQAALVGYLNTTNEAIWVPAPLECSVVITYLGGDVQSEWLSSNTEPREEVRLAPYESTYGVVRFVAPKPASYYLVGWTHGVASQPMDVRTLDEQELGVFHKLELLIRGRSRE